MIHENTQLAYAQVADSLSPCRRSVYEMIVRHGRVTRQDIARFPRLGNKQNNTASL